MYELAPVKIFSIIVDKNSELKKKKIISTCIKSDNELAPVSA